MTIALIIAVFLTILLSLSIAARYGRGNSVPALSMIIWAAGVTYILFYYLPL